MLTYSADVADRAGWNPWQSLREREHIAFAVNEAAAECGGGVYWPRAGRAAIILDPALTRVERNAALAHELIHEDLPGASEDKVEDEVARRLVPSNELAAMKAIAELNDLPVEVWTVAEKFDVPDAVAERAMRLYLEEHR